MRQTDWKKVRFPYEKNEKKERNFEKFLKAGNFDIMAKFNYGDNFYFVARGINPRYNPNAKECDVMFPTNLLSHLLLLRNSTNGDTVLVAQPYFTSLVPLKLNKSSESYKALEKFCNYYQVSFEELNYRQSFYTSEYPTRLIVIGTLDVINKFE